MGMGAWGHAMHRGCEVEKRRVPAHVLTILLSGAMVGAAVCLLLCGMYAWHCVLWGWGKWLLPPSLSATSRRQRHGNVFARSRVLCQ